jgi:hypothetical protein
MQRLHRVALQLVTTAVTLASAALVTTSASAKTLEAKPGCPSEMAQIGGSCVDKWEASLVDAKTGAPFSPFTSPKDAQVKAVSQPSVVPQAHVSLVQAKAACAEAGKRLCHAAEWKTACKGPQGTKYPYGETHVANACVDTDRTAPLGKLHSGGDMYTSKAMNDERLNQLPNTVGKTGEATACTNEYGVHDMVGNVHEWVDDGGFHGGYYLDTKINREGCDYVTTAHNSVYYDYSTGFRCCADVGTLETEEPVAKPEPKIVVPETKTIATDESVLERLARILSGSSSTSMLGGGNPLGPAIPLLVRPGEEKRRAK